jgi:FAD-dependent urate hydroxylase
VAPTYQSGAQLYLLGEIKVALDRRDLGAGSRTKELGVSASEVLIIGAGPYGLSISAHLRGLGVDHLIVGRPLDTWRAHMPEGMYLKSEPYGSDMSCPQSGYDLPGYGRSRGIGNIERGTPLSLERFVDYADWYTEQLVPGIKDLTVTEIKAVNGGFQVAFADADAITVRQVVVATGVLPHAFIPAELSHLPSGLVSHTADHHTLDQFRGRRVVVVGSGQSALETAALLHETGADTQVVARCDFAPQWHPEPLPLNLARRIRLPVVKLCEGWKCVVWNSPAAFRRLPLDLRIEKAVTVLGPRGAWWLRERIEGQVEVLKSHDVRAAEVSGSGVKLTLKGPKRSSVDADHVIAGTGFRIDVARLTFLPQALQARIATLNGFPVISRGGESTVPGLYFAGAPAAVGLGPSMRFLAGTHHAAGQLARSVARRSKLSRGDLAAPTTADHVIQSSDDTALQGMV